MGHSLLGAQPALLHEIHGAGGPRDQEQAHSADVRGNVKHEQRARHALHGITALTNELRAHQKSERDRRYECPEREQPQPLAQREVRSNRNQRSEAERKVQGVNRAHARQHAGRNDVDGVQRAADGEQAWSPLRAYVAAVSARQVQEKQRRRRRVGDDTEIESNRGDVDHGPAQRFRTKNEASSPSSLPGSEDALGRGAGRLTCAERSARCSAKVPTGDPSQPGTTSYALSAITIDSPSREAPSSLKKPTVFTLPMTSCGSGSPLTSAITRAASTKRKRRRSVLIVSRP